MAIIPVTGVPVVLFPAALIQALQGNYGAALGIALLTVGIAQVDNVLRPRLVGRDAGMHDLLIFFSTLGGIITFGAMGFIVGPVLAAFFLSLLDIYAQEFQVALGEEKRRSGAGEEEDDSTDSEPPPGPSPTPSQVPADS
jgi:predicted PurR-regulated permease PerM